MRTFFRIMYVSREVPHYHVVLFDALFIMDDFNIVYCTAETIVIKNVVYLS